MKLRLNRALVVGGNALQRGTLEFNLAKAGFVVTTAEDANEAFHLAIGQQFNLIITEDIVAGGSGVALARQLRFSEQYDTTPIVLLTDKKPEELDMGFLRKSLLLLVIHKPCNLAELVTKVSNWLTSNHCPC